jgi:hypothetical protein
MKINLLKTNYYLLGFNIIFWFFIVIYFSFFKFVYKPEYLIIEILLFFEPLIFIGLLVGIVRKIKIIYILGLFFLVINAVLSITDELGLFDIISLLLSITTFITLLSIHNIFLKE